MKTSTNPPAATQGTDAAKKIVGRKRSVVTDTLGLLLAVIVMAASVTENRAGIQALDQAKATYPTITKTWVDAGFKNQFDRTRRHSRKPPARLGPAILA